jgi:hypothetical protein
LTETATPASVATPLKGHATPSVTVELSTPRLSDQ